MITSMNFSTINTKISAIKAKLLSDEDFEIISRLQSNEEVVDYLNNHTIFNEVLWDLKGKDLHRGEIERRITKLKFEMIYKISHYLKDIYYDYINSYMLRYEIDALKVVFEVAIRGRSINTIDERLFNSFKFSDINFSTLLDESTPSEILNHLKETKYYQLILPYIDSSNERLMFYLEIVLDKYYYRQLVEASEKIDDSKYIIILRKLIDLYNLEWIYRAMKFFDMSKNEILNYSLSYGYKYDYGKLQDIIYSLDISTINEFFKDTEYGFLFNHDHDIDLYMERRINRFMYYKSLKLYHTSPTSFDKVASFISLLEFQVRDIISIIESKRYSMNADEISKYLIRTIEVVE